MHRPGSLASLLFSLPVMLSLGLLTACPKEQVSPGDSAGITGVTSVTTAEPTTVGLPTTSGASTGSSGTPTEASSTGTSSGSDASGGTSSGTDASSGSSSGDPGLGGTGTTGEPMKLADCFGCLCDINVSFCRIVFAGVQPAAFAGPDEFCPIVEAASEETGCVMFPARCAESPACDCLPTMDGGCFCNEIDPGDFQVACPLP